MADAPDEDIVNIRSAVDPATGKAACFLDWGPVQTLLDPEIALNTARDLMAAAAQAETDIALVQVFRDHLQVGVAITAQMLRDIRAARPMLPGKVALRIEAVAGAATGMPYVHIGRGSMKGSLSPAAARSMALDWTQTAVAGHIDARLRYVLGEYDQLTETDIDNIFAGLRAAGGEQPAHHENDQKEAPRG